MSPFTQLAPRSIAPLDDACRMSVVIPAKNEAALILGALEALAAQRTLDGTVLNPRTYEIIVFCNDCDDGTAHVVRRFAARDGVPAVHAIEGTLPAGVAHVGTARRALLDLASGRFLGAGRPYGIVASTDADSQVDRHWVAWTREHLQRVDAVAGHVEIAEHERERMMAPLRLLYDRECTYRRLLGEMEALENPLDYDPAPRHAAFVGASFAVTASIYHAAGGLPVAPRLEDQAFARRLDLIDARVRHSYAVRVATSARPIARVDGGFASFIGELASRGTRRESFPVLAARASIAESRARAALRRVFTERHDTTDYARVKAYFRLEAAVLDEIVAHEATAGAAFARAMTLGNPRIYGEEPVESSIAKLRALLVSRKPVAPILARTASGAG